MPNGQLNLPFLKAEPQGAFTQGTHPFTMYHNFLDASEAAKAAMEKFALDDRIRKFEGKMVPTGNGACAWDLKRFMLWYLRIWNEEGKERADQLANAFLNDEPKEVAVCLWVLGLKCENTLSLGSDLSLVPLSEMPYSDDAASFMTHFFGAEPAITPLSAIVCSTTLRQQPWAASEIERQVSSEALNTAHTKLFWMSALLNAVPTVCCVPYYSTSYCQNAPFGVFSGSGGSKPVLDIATRSITTATPEKLLEFSGLLESFERCSPKMRERMLTSLGRLRDSKARLSWPDKILDLTIAVEMLVLSDNQKDQLRQSFALRSAWLLGSDAASREGVYDRFLKLYDLRSQVAHTGASESIKAMQYDEFNRFFASYELTCCHVVQSIVKRGTPNWRKLVLGADGWTGD